MVRSFTSGLSLLIINFNFFVKCLSKFVLVVILFTSCQHLQPFAVENLSVSQSPLFSNCFPNEGIAKVNFENTSLASSSQEIIWNQKAADQFHLEAVTQFGNTVAELNLTKNIFSAKNLNFSELREFEVKDSQIYINGYRSGILTREVGCLFSGFLPYNWVAHANLAGSNSQTLYFNSHDREIELNLQKQNEVCAIISTSYFLGLASRNFTWCVKRNNEIQSATLRFDGNQKITVESTHE